MRPSVKSFFITLGLYVALVSALWQLEFSLPKQESTRISLASINILKPKCECKKCTCKSHLHNSTKALDKPMPLLPPKPLAKPKKTPLSKPKKTPKKVRKKTKKRRHPKTKPKTIQRIKKAQKPPKTPPVPSKPPAASEPTKHPSKPPATSALAKPCAKPLERQSSKSAPTSFQPTLKPKVSYREEYFKKHLSSIREAIARHKFYPRLARKTRKEGEVVVEFALTPQGLQSLKVVHTSGYTILDRAAIRTIQKASKEFPTPKEPITLKVPLEYRLR